MQPLTESSGEPRQGKKCAETTPAHLCGQGGAFEVFAKVTSAHGMAHIMTSESGKVRRIMWLLAFLTCVAFLIFLFISLLLDIKSYPFKTVNKVAPRNSLVFPVVTVCDLNFVYADKFNHSEEVKTLFRIVDPIFLRNFYNTTLDDIRHKEPFKSLLRKRFLDFINQGAPTVHDAIPHCFWQEQPVECEELFSYIVTPIGRCFKLKSSGANPKVSYRAGPRGGLYMIMRINQEGYTASLQYAAGFKLLLRHLYDYPDVYSNGLLVSPGFHYDISFQMHTYKYLPSPFKSLGDRPCTDPSLEDHGLEEYSLSACILIRSEYKTLELCGCSIDNCTLEEYLICFRPNFTMIYEKATQGDLLGCSYPCFSSSYMPILSQAKIPTPGAGEVIMAAYPSVSPSEMRDTFVTISLFFDDLIVRESEHVPEYDTLSILGTVGGYMGLFLGASLLTLAEMAEFITFLLWRILHKLNSAWCGEHKVNSGQAV